jgi:membrane protein
MKQITGWLDCFYLSLDRRLGSWPSLFIRTALAFDQDDGAMVARSIAYYALFSLLPVILVVIALSSSVLAVEDTKQTVLEVVGRYFPPAVELVEENIEQVLSARNTIGILALLGLFWSASGVFTAMYRAVNRAWGNPKSELFWTEKLYGLAVVFVFGLLLLVTTLYGITASVLQGWQVSFLGWQPFVDSRTAQLWGWLTTLVPPVVTVVTFAILYRTIPRNRVTWRDVWLGGLLAGLTWEAARRAYAWYLANFARYSLIYGSLGAIIGFMLYAYLSAMILLLGAEFTAQHTAWRQAGRPQESRPPSQWIGEWTK